MFPKRVKKIVFILGGGLVKGENDNWKTVNLGEGGDKFGSTNDRLRVEAGAIVFKKEPEIFLIVLGGRGNFGNELPKGLTVAKVMKSELVSLDVPEEKIIEENKSGNTFAQLKYIARVFSELKPEMSMIISNEWHLPRVKVMIEKRDELLRLRSKRIHLQSAEKLLLEYEPDRYRSMIEKGRNSEEIKIRREIESEGVRAIVSGRYSYRD